MTATLLQDPHVSQARARRRNVLGWTGIGALVLLIAAAAVAISAGSPADRGTLDPDSHAPRGTHALVSLLEDRGIVVDIVRSRTEVVPAIAPGTTLVLEDPAALSESAIQEMIDAADGVVAVEGTSRMARLLGLGEDGAGYGSDAVGPECSVRAFSETGAVTPGRLFRPLDGVRACYRSEGGSAGVLLDDRDGGWRALVDGTRLLTNEHLATDGNAALALALLGQRERIVWYVGSIGDTDLAGTAPDTLGSRTPEWVTPAILVLLAGGLAAALWRGRRFGPLVAETLPVTVRGSETMQGRARLTARAADARHAAAALRAGTLSRLSSRLSLPPRSTPESVADATADRIRQSRARIRTLLTGALPDNDTALVSYARSLSELEDAIDALLRTERNHP